MTASNRFRECGGHLRMTITMPEPPNFQLGYDHGKGIYPIAPDHENPGYAILPTDTCTFLNHHLNALGFDDRELGISH